MNEPGGYETVNEKKDEQVNDNEDAKAERGNIKREKSFFQGFQSMLKLNSEKNLSETENEKPQVKKNIREFINKPFQIEFWVKSIDSSRTPFYYNTLTGETSWIPPCSHCQKPSDKWCVQCKAAFCDRHFMKIHLPKADKASQNSIVDTGLENHEFSINEVGTVRAPLKDEEEYCIECQYHVAEVVCRSCWDGYCVPCFQKVHRVGALQTHYPMPYNLARSNWFMIRGQAGNPDYFFNGTTKESTFEKPIELMNKMEKLYFQNWKQNQSLTEQLTEHIDTLQFELEKTRYDKDKMLLEMNEMSSTFKTNLTMNNQSVDMDALFGSNPNKQSDYRQMLLNPSNRKRGQARTKYIKELLDMPFPT